MKIWLIQCGEPLPIDSDAVRLMRIGLLAENLWQRGHIITWWSGSFNHTQRVPRATQSMRIDFRERYSFRLLHGAPYKRSISVSRLWNHYQVARAFARGSVKESRPDAILCCVPTLELAEVAVEFGHRQNIPVIIDYRDLWPDIFVLPFPRMLRPLVRAASYRWFRMARKAFSGAKAITGMTDEFVNHGLRHGQRTRDLNLDRSFPHGYPAEPVEKKRLEEAFSFWVDKGISHNHRNFVVCIFGHLSKRLELPTAILAVRRLVQLGYPIKLVVCGIGDSKERFQRLAEGSDAILFPGFVSLPQIQALMKLSQVGILAYPSDPDFAASIPNKVIEYFSGELPVVSGVRGILSELLDTEQVGLTYTFNSPESLGEALIRYLQDPGLLARHSANAGRLFEERFSAEKVYSEMADHLEYVINY